MKLSGSIILAVTLALGLSVFGHSYGIRYFSQQIVNELQATLPDQLAYATPSWDGDFHSWANVARQIDNDLRHLTGTPNQGVIKSCSAHVLRFENEVLDPAPTAGRHFTIKWARGSTDYHLEMVLNCRTNIGYVITVNSFIALAASWLLLWLPRPLPPRLQNYRTKFRQTGIPNTKAHRLCRQLEGASPSQLAILDQLLSVGHDSDQTLIQTVIAQALHPKAAQLSEDQQRWFNCALAKDGNDFERALDIATQEDCLRFFPSESRLEVHGMSVPMAATPFVYYLWYALQRLQDSDAENGGWFINPPSDRADRKHSDELLQLMRTNKGHAKAIRDLEEKGLRAKVLDQNRSKVKDQLIDHLGESLSASYLFEFERDPKTARFRYRLLTPPPKIRIKL